jgi:hypothetical protein
LLDTSLPIFLFAIALTSMGKVTFHTHSVHLRSQIVFS